MQVRAFAAYVIFPKSVSNSPTGTPLCQSSLDVPDDLLRFGARARHRFPGMRIAELGARHFWSPSTGRNNEWLPSAPT